MSSSDNGKRGLESSDDCFAVTPSDGTDFAVVARCLLITTGGTLKFHKPDGTAVTTTVPTGYFMQRVKRVWATGTTATGITAFV